MEIWGHSEKRQAGVCYGEECRIYVVPNDISVDRAEKAGLVDWLFKKEAKALVPDVKSNVCTEPRAAGYSEVTWETEAREVLARGLFMTLYPNTPVTGTLKFEVQWTDGTTDLFQANWAAPFKLLNTKRGTGKSGSNCKG